MNYFPVAKRWSNVVANGHASILRQITLAAFSFALVLFADFSATAQIIEYAIPSSPALPQSMVAGPDGAYWFTELNAQRLGRVDTNGVVTEPVTFAVNVDSAPFKIIVGPDTNLWVTEAHNDRIARISSGTTNAFTNYVLTEFRIHTNVVTNCQPSGIAVGPDGNLWFLEFTPNLIGVMDTNGHLLHEYGTNFFPQLAELFNIAAGPDGAMWFTDFSYSGIGRIDMAGNLSEIMLPTNCQPLDIIAGPDGAMWFTEYNSNRIGRLTTTNTYPTNRYAASNNYSYFPVPSSSGNPGLNNSQDPYRLTVGSDGNIWFTEYFGNSIARLNIKATNFVPVISTNNFITEFPTPIGGSQPNAIASGGPDKGIWFAEYAANAVGTFFVPTLSISLNTNSQIVVTWPVTATDYILQGNTTLTNTNWVNITAPPIFVVSNTFVYTNTATNLDFFRLFLNVIP